jgi:hypothetical protein
MCPRLCSSSAYVQELFAITEAIKKWRHQYLLGNKFHIYTDHKILKSSEQQKWLTKLIGYSFEIHYKPGKENVVANALSRIPNEATAICATISSPFFPTIHSIFN